MTGVEHDEYDCSHARLQLYQYLDGEMNPDSVWFYPEPTEAAAAIKGRYAFWKGVVVTN